MARTKETKELEKPDAANQTLKKILEDNKEEHYNFHKRIDWTISTGSLLLDSAVKGIKPSLVRLAGQSGEGKSAQALEICRNFLNTVENSKVIWVIAEGRGLSDEHKERCGLKFVYDPEQWEIGTVFVLESNVYELLIDIIRNLITDNPDNIRYCFVVDSFDGLMLRKDLSKEIDGERKVAGAPALTKKMFQSLSLGMFKFGHLMIGLSQVSTDIKIDPYVKTNPRMVQSSGGKSLEHIADFVLEFNPTYQGDIILDNPNGRLGDGKTQALGKYVKVTIQKTAQEKARKQTIQYPIKYGKKPCAIWIEREVGDMILGWGLAKKKGAWITIDESLIEEAKENNLGEVPENIQGIENFYNFLEENPKLTQYLLDKIKKLYL